MSFSSVSANRTDLPNRRVTATRDQRTDQKGSTELTEERRELDAHGKLRSRDSNNDPHKTGAEMPAMFVFVTEVRKTELSTADAINDPLPRCYSGRNRKPIDNPPSSPSSSQSLNHPVDASVFGTVSNASCLRVSICFSNHSRFDTTS